MKKIAILIILFSCLACQAAEPDYNKLADIIYKIEGGAKTKYPYGIMSIKTSNPRQVCINTCKNNYKRWQAKPLGKTYFDYLADVYCPPSADRQGNINWKRNLKKLYN